MLLAPRRRPRGRVDPGEAPRRAQCAARRRRDGVPGARVAARVPEPPAAGGLGDRSRRGPRRGIHLGRVPRLPARDGHLSLGRLAARPRAALTGRGPARRGGARMLPLLSLHDVGGEQQRRAVPVLGPRRAVLPSSADGLGSPRLDRDGSVRGHRPARQVQHGHPRRHHGRLHARGSRGTASLAQARAIPRAGRRTRHRRAAPVLGRPAAFSGRAVGARADAGPGPAIALRQCPLVRARPAARGAPDRRGPPAPDRAPLALAPPRSCRALFAGLSRGHGPRAVRRARWCWHWRSISGCAACTARSSGRSPES